VTYLDRKQARTTRYLTQTHGWKLRACAACSGSGIYDQLRSPPCAACDGTGRERYRPAPPDITDREAEALLAAVTIARNEQIQRVDDLRRRLAGAGFSTAEVESALRRWANREGIHG
jgi:hypothetical protein